MIFFSRRIACKIKVMRNRHFIPTAGKACQKVMPGKACQKVMPNGHRKEFLCQSYSDAQRAFQKRCPFFLGQFGLSQLFKYFSRRIACKIKVMPSGHRNSFQVCRDGSSRWCQNDIERSSVVSTNSVYSNSVYSTTDQMHPLSINHHWFWYSC